jgi:hypothetical protein
MSRPNAMTYVYLVLGWLWALASLGAAGGVVYFMLRDGGEVLWSLALVLFFLLVAAWSVRESRGTWTEARAWLLVRPDGVQLDRYGEQRYDWSQIARFDADDPTPDEDGLVCAAATMHLNDGRRIALPGLEVSLEGPGAYRRRKIAEHVATLNRLRDEDALRRAPGST